MDMECVSGGRIQVANSQYVQIVDTMWVMDADLSFARAHYVRIVDTMWVLDADLSFAKCIATNSTFSVGQLSTRNKLGFLLG